MAARAPKRSRRIPGVEFTRYCLHAVRCGRPEGGRSRGASLVSAWWFVNARLGDWFRRRFEKFGCVCRDESASPATGSNAAHKLEQARLIEQAFTA